MLSKTQAVFAGEKWGVRQIAAELMWFASLEMQRTGLARPLRAKGNCFFFFILACGCFRSRAPAETNVEKGS